MRLRPITDADMPFLLRLYATTRMHELAQVPWTDVQKAAFIVQQFTAQHEHWQANYTDTTWDLILRDDEPIGRLYVSRWLEEIRIIDIALLPEYRNAGIGTGGGATTKTRETSTSIPAGGQLLFTLSGASNNTGVTGNAGFQGYIIARCFFQYAHGFAFISDLGSTRLAEGYLALVMDAPLSSRTGSTSESLGN